MILLLLKQQPGRANAWNFSCQAAAGRKHSSRIAAPVACFLTRNYMLHTPSLIMATRLLQLSTKTAHAANTKGAAAQTQKNGRQHTTTDICMCDCQHFHKAKHATTHTAHMAAEKTVRHHARLTTQRTANNKNAQRGHEISRGSNTRCEACVRIYV